MTRVPLISTWLSEVQVAIIGNSIGSIMNDAISDVMSRAKELWWNYEVADVLAMAESSGLLRVPFKPWDLGPRARWLGRPCVNNMRRGSLTIRNFWHRYHQSSECQRSNHIMEANSLLARKEATEQMSSAQNQVLAVMTTHSSFVTAFAATPVCIRHECTSNSFRHGALCPDCSFKATLLKARVDESTSDPHYRLGPHLSDSSFFPDPSELAGSELSGYTTAYTPRISYIRSILLMILGFHIQNLIQS